MFDQKQISMILQPPLAAITWIIFCTTLSVSHIGVQESWPAGLCSVDSAHWGLQEQGPTTAFQSRWGLDNNSVTAAPLQLFCCRFTAELFLLHEHISPKPLLFVVDSITVKCPVSVAAKRTQIITPPPLCSTADVLRLAYCKRGAVHYCQAFPFWSCMFKDIGTK